MTDAVPEAMRAELLRADAVAETLRAEVLRDLRDAVRGLLAAAGGAGGAGGAAWGRLGREVGVAGLAIPERYGGAGGGAAEVGAVLEELGRELTPCPMLGSTVLAAQALLGSGDEAACERLLPAIAGGSATAALAWTTPAGRWSVAADGSGP